MLNLLAAFAQFERELIVRTQAGQPSARRAGKYMGRPRLIVNRQKVQDLAAAGMTTRQIGEQLGISASSVCRMLT